MVAQTGGKSGESEQSAGYARRLIEASIDPLVTISHDGKITDVNEATVKATGVPRENLIGTNFSDYFTEPEKANAGYKQALKEGMVEGYHLVLKNKSGKLMNVLYNASVYKDEKGNILGIFASARDITSRKKAEFLEGAEELLSEWGYGLDEFAFATREGLNNFREIERTAATHWFKRTVGELPKVKTAYEAAIQYRDMANERKVISKDNFKLEEKEGTILGTFLSHDCPYRNCCIERQNEHKQFLCFRATLFVVAIRLMADKEYRADVLYEQTQPGKVCILKGVPTQISFKVGLSYKLGKGNIKINEIDCGKVGIDIIDKVTVSASRKELAGRKLTLMSASQTKFPAGMIIMSIADAKSLGLEEKDTVYIKKAGEGEDVELVDLSKYEAKPGEYDKDYNIKGLEVEEDKEKIIGTKKEIKPEKEFAETTEEVAETSEEEQKIKDFPTSKSSDFEEPKQEVEQEKKKKIKKPNPGDIAKKEKQKKDFESKIDALRDS